MDRYKKVIRIFLIIFAVILVAAIGLYVYFSLAFSIFSRDYYDDLIIQSPDGKGFLIIKEWSFLLGSGAEVYYVKGEKDWWFNKTELGETGVGDDGYCPFQDGKYIIDWQEDYVEIKYYTAVPAQSPKDPDTWRVDRFDLP